jgi:glycosyltransferase involved in cell wall biosynthesis
VPPEKIVVVHHGVAGRFRPHEDDRRSLVDGVQPDASQQPATPREPYFLYVGTIQPRKNLVRLLEAFAQLSPEAPRLVIAGKRGWLSAPIERRAAELGLAERVVFAGYVPDAELPGLLRGALAFVFPSLYEGFGMPVLEAMAAGVPVLTSSTSALPEVAGDAALLVDPCDTAAIAGGMARLAGDASLRADLRARGLARAAEFTWERCARETLAVLTIDEGR